MSAVPGLADRAASLLEADPRLGYVIGRRDAAEVGHRAILPVLSVVAGPWAPPEPASLGADTVALAVLDGLLVTPGNGLTGPGDVIAPWGASWIACSPARLAVIGRSYLEALRPWPVVANRIRARAAANMAAAAVGAGTLEERLLELLWRVALRWGEPWGTGVALPRALDLRALSAILEVGEMELAITLAALREDGIGATRDGSMWLPSGRAHGAGAQARRDALRSRAALQHALARAAHDDFAALCDELDLALQRREDLRADRR